MRCSLSPPAAVRGMGAKGTQPPPTPPLPLTWHLLGRMETLRQRKRGGGTNTPPHPTVCRVPHLRLSFPTGGGGVMGWGVGALRGEGRMSAAGGGATALFIPGGDAKGSLLRANEITIQVRKEPKTTGQETRMVQMQMRVENAPRRAGCLSPPLKIKPPH